MAILPSLGADAREITVFRAVSFQSLRLRHIPRVSPARRARQAACFTARANATRTLAEHAEQSDRAASRSRDSTGPRLAVLACGRTRSGPTACECEGRADRAAATDAKRRGRALRRSRAQDAIRSFGAQFRPRARHICAKTRFICICMLLHGGRVSAFYWTFFCILLTAYPIKYAFVTQKRSFQCMIAA